MIVEFVNKNYIPVQGQKSLSSLIGRRFLVIEILISDHEVEYNIVDENDLDYPKRYNAKHFTIVSNKIPSQWGIDYNAEYKITRIMPLQWLNRDTWQGYFWGTYLNSDDELHEQAVQSYKEEVTKIYQECGLGLVEDPFGADKLWYKEQGKIECPVCEEFSFERESFPGSYESCYNCGWVDDFIQYKDPESTEGVNKFSLNQAKENYDAFGKADPSIK